jgi:hypothetical protein
LGRPKISVAGLRAVYDAVVEMSLRHVIRHLNVVEEAVAYESASLLTKLEGFMGALRIKLMELWKRERERSGRALMRTIGWFCVRAEDL